MRIKDILLFGWIRSNVIGGSIGFVCGIVLSQFFSTSIEFGRHGDLLHDYHLMPMINGLLFWLPLGLSIGIAQWLKLRGWEIQTRGWVFATVTGWTLLGIVLGYTDDYSMRQNSFSRWRILLLGALIVLLGGSCIGLFQSLALRKTFPKLGSWILANMLGVFGTIAMSLAVLFVPFALKSYILKFFYAHDLYVLVEARDLLLLVFFILSVPFIAMFTLFLPTGKVLVKYMKTG